MIDRGHTKPRHEALGFQEPTSNGRRGEDCNVVATTGSHTDRMGAERIHVAAGPLRLGHDYSLARERVRISDTGNLAQIGETRDRQKQSIVAGLNRQTILIKEFGSPSKCLRERSCKKCTRE